MKEEGRDAFGTLSKPLVFKFCLLCISHFLFSIHPKPFICSTQVMDEKDERTKTPIGVRFWLVYSL